MKKLSLIFAVTFFALTTTASAQISKIRKAGNLKTSVVDAISSSGYNKTASVALKTSGLETALKADGPYTVFAPADDAFNRSKQETDSLMRDKIKLGEVMKYHVVKGNYGKDEIIKALTEGNGETELTTMEGEKLTLKVNSNKNLEIIDPKGDKAIVTVFDLEAGNGVVHVINNVLAP